MKLWLWILHRAPIDSSALDLDEWPDSGIVADRAAVEVRERVHGDALPESDVVDEPVRRVVRRPVSHRRTRTRPTRRPATTCDSVIPGKIGSERHSRAIASATGNASFAVSRAMRRRGSDVVARDSGDPLRRRSRERCSASPPGSPVLITKRCHTGGSPGRREEARGRRPPPALEVERRDRDGVASFQPSRRGSFRVSTERLNGVEPRGPADLVVVVLPALPVLAKRAHTRRERRVVGHERPGITHRPEVLPGIEAEAAAIRRGARTRSLRASHRVPAQRPRSRESRGDRDRPTWHPCPPSDRRGAPA